MNGETMSETCEIAGPGARCRIQVLGYENPAAQDPSDANWLSCRVAIRGDDSLSAEGPAALSVQDFSDFAEDLHKVLRGAGGTASFTTDEEDVSLNIEIKKTGTASVTGVLRLSGNVRATLSFAFESDQTFLAEAQRQLEAIARAFPARPGPTPA